VLTDETAIVGVLKKEAKALQEVKQVPISMPTEKQLERCLRKADE